MKNRLFTWSKAILLGGFLTLSCNDALAQGTEIQYGLVDVPGNTEKRKFSYLQDELGYFDKLHGEQSFSEYIRNYGLVKMTIEYDNGTPVHYEGEIKDRKFTGKYDNDGICSSFVEESEFSKDLGPITSVLSTKREGTMVKFVGKTMTGFSVGIGKEKRTTTTSFGYIDGTACLIVNSSNWPDEYSDILYLSNSIFSGKNLFYFTSKNLMDSLFTVVSRCKNIQEFSKEGFYFSNETSSFNTLIKEKRVQVGHFMYPAISHTLLSASYGITDAFLGCNDYYSKISNEKIRIPKKFLYTPIIKLDGEEYLSYKEIKFDVFKYIKNVLVVKRFKAETKPLSFMTEEQYEKYKTRLEYDAKEGKHGVKKADGAYLYIPSEIESTLTKTDEEKALDEKQAKRVNNDLKQAEIIYNIAKRAIDFKEAEKESVLLVDSKFKND